MTRWRTTLAALTAGAAALSLAACGGSSAGSDSDGRTTITFWNSYTASDRPAVEELVKDFNDSQDQYQVDMTIQPGDVLTKTLLPAYQSGKGPTLVALDASMVPSYAKMGVIQPVDDAYGDGGLDASLLPKASLDATTYQGKQYGIPFGATPTMLYWNKTLFAAAGITEPPTTLEEMAADAVTLTDESTGQYGIALADREAPSAWATFLWAGGGGIVSDDGTTSTFGDPASIQAMTTWGDLVTKQHVSPVGLNGVDGDTLFGAGKAGMLINGPWVSAGLTEAGLDYGITPVPAGSVEQTSIAISTNLHLNAEASAQEKRAAYAFADFWNSTDSQTTWSVKTGYPPNRSDVPASALAANPTAAAFAGKSNSRFYLGGLLKASQIDSDVVVPTIQRITAGEGTAADLMPAAAQQIDALLDR